MVKLLPDGLDGPLDLAIVDQVALLLVDLTFHHNLDAEGMAMDTPALVPLRKGRQPMGGLKAKYLGKTDTHNNAQQATTVRPSP